MNTAILKNIAGRIDDDLMLVDPPTKATIRRWLTDGYLLQGPDGYVVSPAAQQKLVEAELVEVDTDVDDEALDQLREEVHQVCTDLGKNAEGGVVDITGRVFCGFQVRGFTPNTAKDLDDDTRQSWLHTAYQLCEAAKTALAHLGDVEALVDDTTMDDGELWVDVTVTPTGDGDGPTLTDVVSGKVKAEEVVEVPEGQIAITVVDADGNRDTRRYKTLTGARTRAQSVAGRHGDELPDGWDLTVVGATDEELFSPVIDDPFADESLTTGEILRMMRKDQQMTLAEVGEAIGVWGPNISRVETTPLSHFHDDALYEGVLNTLNVSASDRHKFFQRLEAEKAIKAVRRSGGNKTREEKMRAEFKRFVDQADIGYVEEFLRGIHGDAFDAMFPEEEDND